MVGKERKEEVKKGKQEDMSKKGREKSRRTRIRK